MLRFARGVFWALNRGEKEKKSPLRGPGRVGCSTRSFLPVGEKTVVARPGLQGLCLSPGLHSQTTRGLAIAGGLASIAANRNAPARSRGRRIQGILASLRLCEHVFVSDYVEL